MSHAASPPRSTWGRRFLGLATGIVLCLFLLFLDLGDEAWWAGLLRLTAALVVLALGIYEFVRREKRKPNC
jgi:high-affinity Fe2+/Pb2+ permease